ncbi:hypothetical protein WH52_13090 [Tenacibaculum holothuriorum]|uniref:Glycine zipper family protein n=1 Tax=Tenacibaculum holothuriorum TaxID=1635173 RepID=A0A1Y2P9S9_9FLAO|nr:hypothetical protein [Tenacibaculum holothuriorum]OSY87192.1 hypothetical protein WH52_13090 [Tenacibaculum holothuriorum]
MKKSILLLLLFVGSLALSAQDNSKKIELNKVFGGYTFKQDGKHLSFSQVADLMKNNQEAYKIIQSAKSNKTWATVLGVAGGALIGWPIGTAIGGGDAKWELAAIGAGLVGIAIPISNGFNKKSKRAVELYNNGLQTSASSFNPSIQLKLKGNGLGLALQF